jgi:plastocyanin
MSQAGGGGSAGCGVGTSVGCICLENEAYANCHHTIGPINYLDATADNANRTIMFGLIDGTYQYNPKCLTVRTGQTVTFQAAGSDTFATLPLVEVCGPDDSSASMPNELSTSSGTSRSYVVKGGNFVGFPDYYNYYDPAHGSSDGSGMAGSIEVKP